MYIRGMIPRNFTELVEAVPIGLASAQKDEMAQLPSLSDNTISTSKDSIEIVKKRQFTRRN